MAHGTSGNLYNISIKVLTTRTVKQLCDSLNTLMILPAENGLLRFKLIASTSYPIFIMYILL